MSDPDVPENKSADSVDDVVGSANEGLDAAAAARADVPPADGAADAVDPDLEAFAAAERDHPGTFLTTEQAAAAADAGTEPVAATDAVGPAEEYVDSTGPVPADSIDTSVHTTSVADTAYAAPAVDSAAETQVVPAEPVAPPPVVAPQPIFVQAPEPPRELGNRATAGAIGLLAMVSFAILYLGAILGIGAVEGTVTVENVGTAAVAPLSTWSFWVPVVIFYIAFWLLGAIINRGRWGHWVIFGLFVGAAAYGGHLLGQLFQAPFWRLTPTEAVELLEQQAFAPLAIGAFLFARELTIWFGAWVARSGARKKELNAEAQAEYERTLEAGPSALR
ncbi:ABC transporter [Microbacterium esteraromaticum]|uniref:ABC transporter n=1 Tax=Microbacterium esteraromaticum TaxID=57043 RepID=UPI001A8E20AC|nr:ABC transporter [Microbacterium esteraromaticum]MBN8425399.1 ABC transporter [Microbacterium esteraromaticum]